MKHVDAKRITQAILAALDEVPKAYRERELANVISSNETLQARLGAAIATIHDRQDS